MEDDHDALVCQFMQVTACISLSDAAQHLASCSWRLDEAVNLYFAGGAASSAPVVPKDEPAVRAPIPARSETIYGPSSSTARRQPRVRPTGWESEHDDAPAPAAERHPRRRRRRDEGTSSGGSSTDRAGAGPAGKKKKKTLAELFRPPLELTYKGRFHDAKAHAAGLSRWLLVNVQASGEFASHQQNRDVWANELVARAVRERFVLWQVDVDEREDGLDEGGKVSCYYKLAHDMMPHVLVVDPVTGELVHRMRAATDPNDMIAVAEKFAERRPVMPAKATKHRAGSSLAPPPRGKQEAPPVGSAASSSSNPSSEIAPCERKLGTTATKQVETVVDAGATPTCEMAPGPGEKLCKLRVRLPDGRALTKQFGAERGVGALFAFCRSEEERPFRLMRLAGGSMQQIGDENVSFDDLGLHMSTVFMVLC
ncbi:plant UBX domain-containing protein 7-like [Aegilops tauschii subsp. strangulata]|uniref:plant UBX domain-containing protein 7-like n=1 Tax=Aegilops tauschii subsp. strangulata TaxID=200361 RepID=UPI000989F802|nr:plant UBX domain-containing protein 7-like [Aegilops tauschii subsp. strangulata]